MDIKGEMSILNVLHLSVIDIQEISELLQSKMESASQFFRDSPLVLDCQALGKHCKELDFDNLYEVVKTSGFVPVGVRNVPDDCVTAVKKTAWSIMRASKSPRKPESEDRRDSLQQNDNNRVEVVTRPLRSGQQVYAPESDVVVLHQASAGSEILAGGSVHVYGALRGRVLAGVNGAKTARIFCQSLEADLVAIAGCYQLLDDAETDLKGQPAMISLQNGRLVFEPLA